jgi:predicted transcriptional regulator
MLTTLPSMTLGRPNWLSAASCCPREVSAAILRGDSRLKAIRKWRDETQLHLELTTGIGQGYLSDLESGRRTGTPETIAKLAKALKVPVEWLS